MKITSCYFKYLIFILVAIAWFSCKKTDTSVPVPPPPGGDTIVTPVSGKLPEKNIQCSIEGQVYNENGQAFAGVAVTAGTETVTTDKYGFFRFENVTINQNGGMIRVTKAGYFTGIKNLFYKEGVTNYLSIRLVPRKLIGTFSAGTGGTVTIKEAAVIFPENSLVIMADKTAYSGTVNVYADYITASDNDLLQKIPGNLYSVPADNTVAALENYGLLAVALETESGQELQLAGGKEATIQMPAPANAPASLSFYSFDESSGFWNEEGKATKTGNVYVGKARHFSFWSPDVPFPVVDIEGTITDQNNHPLANHLVVITRSATNNFAAAYAITDSSGRISGKVPKNENLLLVTHDACRNAVFSKNIGPFNANTNLGILQAPGNLSWITISGNLIDCTTAPVPSGFAIVMVDDMVFRSPVDNKGHFSMDILNCSQTGIATVSGVDNINFKQSEPTVISLNTAQIDAGSIYACTSLSNESFVSYSVDNVWYTYTMPGYVEGTYYESPYGSSTTITGYNDYVFNPWGATLVFNGGGSPGSYPLFVFNHQFLGPGMIMDSPGTMVQITGFGEVGQFISGYFSDTLIDRHQQVNIPHVVKCVFRVKRTR